MTTNSKPQYQVPLFWKLLMLSMGIFYLLPEIIFNAALVDAASGSTGFQYDIKTVELFGRGISGIGMSMLVMDLWVTKGRLKNPLSILIVAILSFAIIWPTTFFGQKILVDHYLINGSTAKERQQAYGAQIAKQSLAMKTIQLEGIDIDRDAPLTPEDKTFLSVFSGLLFSDERLLKRFEKKAENIVESYVAEKAKLDFDDTYADYKRLKEEVRDMYGRYDDASIDYEHAYNSWPGESDKQWSMVLNNIDTGWGKYQKAVKSFDSKMDAKAQDVTPDIKKELKRLSGCAEEKSRDRAVRCRNNANDRFDREAKRHGLTKLALADFYGLKKRSWAEKTFTKLGSWYLSGGLALLLDGAKLYQGKDISNDYVLVIVDDVSWYKKKLILAFEDDFKKDSGGYPVGISSFTEFKDHAVTQDKARNELRKNGLTLADSWDLTQKPAFRESVKSYVQSEAKIEWRRGIKKQGLDLQPGLSWVQFQESSSLQKKIRNRIGDDAYVIGMRFDWNNTSFYNKVVVPQVKRETKRMIELARSSESKFEDGGKYEEAGKEALRSTLVPPISMALSLFLVLMTAIKIPFQVVGLLPARAPKTPKYEVGAEVKHVEPDTNKSILRFLPLKTSCFLASILLLIALPFTFWGDRITDDSIMAYFEESLEKQDAENVAKALRWTILVQPEFYRLASIITENTPLLAYFDEYSEELAKQDDELIYLINTYIDGTAI
ncbi:hypothetical protein QWY82_10060 [Simiduia curdlanivorans]|uniref:Uncharacterized protein n=1 Tax=Simiduia curdlanivorans TaxID=1492769 RepID=A0ABV8UZQ4_9GAMM|nr:hypothetical protein [Simiduia curdlanivorans]MDN3639153.1 hypothetical protein [Simiduia curdlanivorans]